MYKDGKMYDWPYPVNYEAETEVETDVLILGGGIAGCWAAISAAKGGSKVAIVEKAATITSGAGGSGCDHWINTPNPVSKVTAEDCVDWESQNANGYLNNISRYIAAKESYDTLLEMEQMGGKIRDTNDEFAGADFRDEKTKFLFAYDYENKFHFRIWGKNFKSALYKECKKLGVKIYDRTMATSLLTDGGKQGTKVIGATGLNSRTGELFIFKAKATVMSMSRHSRNWAFSSELTGLGQFRPNIVGTGYAMAFRAGAQFTQMERSMPGNLSFGTSYPSYGTGNAMNTWFPCTIVDANGKQIPWTDRDGKELTDFDQRTHPVKGQKLFGERGMAYDYRRPDITPDMQKRVKNGEFALPLYADMTGMPQMERRAIWGLMVGNEGRTPTPIFRTYNEAGFDPDKDMLQSYLMLGGDWLRGATLPHVRIGGEGPGDSGGLVVDWNLKTTLDSLYAAGDSLFAANYHHHAAATGRYAGRKAAAHANQTEQTKPARKQIDNEKARVYAPIERKNGIEWKELNAGLARVMQNYCGNYKNDELLNIGLKWTSDIEKNVASTACASNPHTLMRTLGVLDILTCNQMILHTSLARKASSTYLGFNRLDYPEIDPPAYHKWITIHQEGKRVKTGELSLDFYGDMESNYEAHK
jgi:succinate dehydrogenase/fumarate reductase flavoprotein subunit